MKLTNKLGLPQPLVDAIANDEYSRGDSDISVTQLIGPPRITELERRHAEDLEEDASDRIFSLFGQAIHTILERANKVGLAEQRLYANVGGWKVSGQFDRMAFHEDESGRHMMQDYKTAKVNEVMYGVKPERELQLNCLAELARLHGHQIDGLEAIFILRDWSKVRAANGGGYPPLGVARIPVPLWDSERAQRYLAERVALHRAVREGAIPPPECSPEERWQDPDKWAVMQPGKKRALKLCDWEAEAVAYANNVNKPTYIERRPSVSVRCQFYCSVAPVCDQWAAIRPATGNEETDG